ncbi:low temperature requirement protein A [Croceitalea rosinachiae]|uniref:Low temperature requirement protein A n=1 Tax=Croceitalea rosinachiae TaxID=3075596 RepID=A0ABU3AC08_9FLAO|nr:low temperature requirement protein A [Croceitalea sp. F388]MDT0607719.1 low temperature requirement protein A [Croceitalea sp. F388]
MNKKSNSIRTWWKKPKQSSALEEHRQVSFLELFYDLVYVALIAQLSHALTDELTMHGSFKFIFLFTMIWWYWLNGSLYHDLYGNNDIRTRVFTFLQMISVVGMAVFASEAFHKGAIGFTISAISLLVILLFLWLRVGYHEKKTKIFSNLYASLLAINIGLLCTSLFVKSPLNHRLWFATITISFLAPTFMYIFSFFSKKMNIHEFPQASAALVERFGLFNIIVLGEIITSAVSGSSHVEFNTKVAILCLLGILLAIGIWWLYYDFISHRKPKKGGANFIFWYYLHLPLTASITSIGASILYIIKYSNKDLSANVHYLFLGSMVIIVLCIAILYRVVDEHSETSKYLNNNTGGLLIISCIYIVLIFIEINMYQILILSVILLFAPILNSIIKNHLKNSQN